MILLVDEIVICEQNPILKDDIKNIDFCCTSTERDVKNVAQSKNMSPES
jgi:hypothetical protein